MKSTVNFRGQNDKTQRKWNKKKVYRIFYGGFVNYGMNATFFKRFKNTEGKGLKIKVTRKQYDKLKSILNNFETNSELYKYDVKGLLIRYFKKKDYVRDKYYVCTVFVADVLKKAKIYSFKKPIDMVKADDFMNIPNAEIVYEGKLRKIKDN